MEPIELFIPSGPGAQAARAKVFRQLEILPETRRYKVEITAAKATRSTSQNAYLWAGVYKAILDQGGEMLRGWTKQDLHEYCLGECFGWEKITAFRRTRLFPKRRSSRLNKQEFTDYIDFIKAHMSAYGIFIPDSDGVIDHD